MTTKTARLTTRVPTQAALRPQVKKDLPKSIERDNSGSTVFGFHATTKLRGYPSGKEDTELYLKKQEEVVTKNNHSWVD